MANSCSSRSAQWAKATFTQKLKFLGLLLSLIFRLPLSVIKSRFAPWNKHLPLARVLHDAPPKLLERAPLGVTQLLMGSTEKSYRSFYTGPAVVDEIQGTEEEVKTKLLWIGDKEKADDILLYFHGGGFVTPASYGQIGLITWLVQELKKTNRNIAVAFVLYDLVPKSDFPYQLKQSLLALSHILKSHSPSNVHLAGDSSGGNLILQILSHTLHPLRDLPPSPLTSTHEGKLKLASAVLISPWVLLTSDGRTYKQNSKSDLVSSEGFSNTGSIVLLGVPDLERNRRYIEPAKVPEGWFEGVEGLFGRMVVTAGEFECMRGDIDHLVSTHLRPYFPKVEHLVEKGGKHTEPCLAFWKNGQPIGGYLPDSATLLLNTYKDLLKVSGEDKA